MATMPARGDVWLVDLGSADLALFVSSFFSRFNDGPTFGDDAKPDQEKQVRRAIEEVQE
jgi:hypothetical protein